MPSRVISTLCSNYLRTLDRIDVSGIKYPTLTLPLGAQSLTYARDYYNRLQFPPNTRGFLYYYTPPKAPPLVGEVRFRLANHIDNFHDGKDLLSVEKIPWSISLFALANHSTHSSLREQLLADGLVSQTTLDKWTDSNNLPLLQKGYPVGRNRTVLYYLRQPFFLQFNAHFIAFYTATRDEIGYCLTPNPFTDRRFTRNNHYIVPYGGSGLVQFEPYKDKLALRLVKIIDPVQDMLKDHDGYIRRPTEGALAQRSLTTVVARSPTSTRMKDALMLPVNFEDLP